jgi:SPP1 gp7 family putative phage head morphogenesis protein
MGELISKGHPKDQAYAIAKQALNKACGRTRSDAIAREELLLTTVRSRLKQHFVALFAATTVQAGHGGPPPQEAINYLKSKKAVVTTSYQDMWKAENKAAFTVARIAELGILSDVQDSLVKALEEGQPYQEWAKGIKDTLDESGWSDYGDTGAPYRLSTIYNTNMRVARSVEEWATIERTKNFLPYLEYNIGTSTHHRDEHVSWDGTILPADDPWWDTHMTPNGFGCKCWVRQLTKRMAEELGITTDAPPGEPDEGWDFNPGKDRDTMLEQALQEAETNFNGS